jgi:hypothetical protein
VVSTLAGSAVGYADGDGESDRFSLPQHIAVSDGGSLLIVDAAKQRIRRIDWN